MQSGIWGMESDSCQCCTTHMSSPEMKANCMCTTILTTVECYFMHFWNTLDQWYTNLLRSPWQADELQQCTASCGCFPCNHALSGFAIFASLTAAHTQVSGFGSVDSDVVVSSSSRCRSLPSVDVLKELMRGPAKRHIFTIHVTPQIHFLWWVINN